MVSTWHVLQVIRLIHLLPLKQLLWQLVATAKAMPDDDARSGASELLHIGLVNMGKFVYRIFSF